MAFRGLPSHQADWRGRLPWIQDDSWSNPGPLHLGTLHNLDQIVLGCGGRPAHLYMPVQQQKYPQVLPNAPSWDLPALAP